MVRGQQITLMQSEAKFTKQTSCALDSQTQRLNMTMAHYLALIAKLPPLEKAGQHKDAVVKQPLTLSRWVR